MVKATTSGHKQKAPEEEEKRHVKRVRRLKSQKRKLNRVESEETQDYVREST